MCVFLLKQPKWLTGIVGRLLKCRCEKCLTRTHGTEERKRNSSGFYPKLRWRVDCTSQENSLFRASFQGSNSVRIIKIRSTHLAMSFWRKTCIKWIPPLYVRPDMLYFLTLITKIYSDAILHNVNIKLQTCKCNSSYFEFKITPLTFLLTRKCLHYKMLSITEYEFQYQYSSISQHLNRYTRVFNNIL